MWVNDLTSSQLVLDCCWYSKLHFIGKKLSNTWSESLSFLEVEFVFEYTLESGITSHNVYKIMVIFSFQIQRANLLGIPHMQSAKYQGESSVLIPIILEHASIQTRPSIRSRTVNYTFDTLHWQHHFAGCSADAILLWLLTSFLSLTWTKTLSDSLLWDIFLSLLLRGIC